MRRRARRRGARAALTGHGAAGAAAAPVPVSVRGRAWPWRSTDRGDSTRASRPRHTGARVRTRGPPAPTRLPLNCMTFDIHSHPRTTRPVSEVSPPRSCSHDISAVRSTCTKVERQRYGTVYAVVRPARSSTCACNENVSLAHSRRLEGPHRQTGRDAVMMDGVKAMRGHGPTRFPARRRAFPPPSCWLRRSL